MSMSPKGGEAWGDDRLRWFEEKIQPHESALRRWLRSKFPQVTDVDDLVQESYLRLVYARGSTEPKNAKAYLFTTARNAAIDIFRQQRNMKMERLVSSEPLTVLEDKPDAAEALSNSQEVELLMRAIESLPDRCREIMKLQKLKGHSNSEIARLLGISVHTVNAQLVLGLSRCRKYLYSRGVTRGNAEQ